MDTFEVPVPVLVPKFWEPVESVAVPKIKKPV